MESRCRRCSNNIFILDLIHCFNSLGKDNYTKRDEKHSNLWDLVLILLILGYVEELLRGLLPRSLEYRGFEIT